MNRDMGFSERLAQERRARLAAERLLDLKQQELLAANLKLSQHALALSDQIVEQRQGLERARDETEQLKGQTSQALSDLERATSLARIAQRRLWDALETLPDGFAVFDARLQLVVANRAYLGLFEGEIALSAGVSYDAVLRIVATRGLVALAGRDPLDWHHEMVARLRQARIEPLAVELSDGRHIRLTDRWGAEGDLVCMIQDITATIRREAELDEARARAEAASRAKSAFLANMSHEIRTPMNGVVGMADLLCGSGLSDEQRLYAETIRSSGEALLTIINDVLDYSKIEAEKLRLYPEPFDLERCLHEVMMLLQPSARDKGLQLLVDFDLFLPTRFVADPGRIRQILTNLLGNAVKFTPAGQVIARVVGFELGGGQYELHITVEDTGIGIAPDQAEHIFGEFNQVESESNRKFEGTGLGLAITKKLVDLMEGTIWVDSEPGRGSCFGFRVTLPAAEPEDAGDESRQPLRIRNALIVDDLMINRVILERQLQTFGLGVSACRTLAEAGAMLAHGRFDVVICDQQLPDGKGIGLLRRPEDGGQRTPVILLADDPGLVAAGRAAGAAATLCKPVPRSVLYRALQAISRPAPAAPPEPPAIAGPARQMRILAAEDNRTNQLVFAKMLKEFDVVLEFADNGHEAVAKWQGLRPDLIFMDISMPGMDGRDATRAIRGAEAAGGLPRTPIVALTAHAMAGDEESILAAGVDHYLTKPLRKAAIAERIRAACPADARPALPPEPAVSA